MTLENEDFIAPSTINLRLAPDLTSLSPPPRTRCNFPEATWQTCGHYRLGIDYSPVRRVSIGSIVAARHAGISTAPQPTTASAIIEEIRETGLHKLLSVQAQ